MLVKHHASHAKVPLSLTLVQQLASVLDLTEITWLKQESVCAWAVLNQSMAVMLLLMEFQTVRSSCIRFVQPMRSVMPQASAERRTIALKSVMVVLEQSSRTSVFVSAIILWLQIKSVTQIADKMHSKQHLHHRELSKFMILRLKTPLKHRKLIIHLCILILHSYLGYQILSVKQSAQKKTPRNVNLWELEWLSLLQVPSKVITTCHLQLQMRANKLQHWIQQQNSDEPLINLKAHQFMQTTMDKTLLSSGSKSGEVCKKQLQPLNLNTFQTLLFVQQREVQFFGVILVRQFIQFIKRIIFLTRSLTLTLVLSPLYQHSLRERRAKTSCLRLLIREFLYLLTHATQLN